MGGSSASGSRKIVGGTAHDSVVEGVTKPEELRLPRGTSIDRYVVLYELGVGGMGIVYAAYDPELDRKVALKLLHAESRSSRARTRLLREAKAIASLRHPNVVTVHDVGTYEDRIFVAMEFIDGLTFRQWTQQCPRSWTEIIDTLRAAGEGLAAAHAADLVHRDFKPDNILVEPQGRVIVLDFGLARRTASASKSSVDSADDPEPEDGERDDGDAVAQSGPTKGDPVEPDVLDLHLTRTGARLGTPAYMAPEQHLSAPTDARTDQFSFCVVAWEALYGARPFRGDSATATAVQVVRGEIQEPPRSHHVPTWIRRVLTRGLSPSPDERYPDMRQLLDALAHDPTRNRRRLAVVGISATVVAIAGGLAVRALTAAPQLCTAEQAAQRFASAWSDHRRVAVRESFLATRLPYAEMTADTVDATMERYADDWIRIYAESCAATNLLREQSEEMLDLQTSCLRARRSQAESLMDEFERADAAVVEHAVEAVLSLPRLADCEDTPALMGRRPLPEDAVARDRVEAVQARLAQARGKMAAGRYAAALALTREVIGVLLDDVDFPSARAEAQLLEATILERRGEFEDAERMLLESVWTAAAAGADETAARAWVQLVWVSGVELPRPEQGLLWSRFAQAAIDGIGGDEMLSATLTHNLGGVYYRQGRLAEALEHYRRALKAQAALLGPNDPAVAMTLNHIGNTLMEQGDFAASREYCERSLKLRTERLGAHHPKVAASLNNLAELYRKQREPARSLQYAERSLAIVAGTAGPEEEIARVLASDAFERLQRWEDKEANDRRLLELRRGSRPARDPLVSDALRRWGRSLFELQRPREAVEAFEAAIEIDRGPRPAAAVRALLELAQREQPIDRARASGRMAEAQALLAGDAIEAGEAEMLRAELAAGAARVPREHR